ncbi:MAG TPA: 16S rRNA (uracil(1498)-N(3))-methyltransferase [Candidatus Binatia bacterium]|nr:16S rRNA (uracil(1498)-N(3))-methyltransferase [Candidatus Binatia bacterium]
MTAARRFFVEGRGEIGGSVEIAGGDAHKIAHVLRLRAGDRLEIIDSTAGAFVAAIDAVEPAVRATLVERVVEGVERALALDVEVAQAVPKGRRMEFVIEKCTELGAAAFLPFYSERSVGRAVGAEKLTRWRRLARAAAQQCGRRNIPSIVAPLDFGTLAQRFEEYAAVLFAWETAQPIALRERLRSALPNAGRLLVVIGPEGGFTHAEAELAERCGATLVWLGARILRTDTAAMVLLAVIGALTS